MKSCNWGLIPYKEALERQLELVSRVQEDPNEEVLIFCSHPPVVTLGRATQAGDVFGWSGETIEVQRGGRATFHGPGQLICYPILDLSLRGKDIHLFLGQLETALIMMLSDLGIRGRQQESATGAWIGDKKIASIGVGIKRWVSYHGLALNLYKTPGAFEGIQPCGFKGSQIAYLEEFLPAQKLGETDLVSKLKSSLEQVLKDKKKPRFEAWPLESIR